MELPDKEKVKKYVECDGFCFHCGSEEIRSIGEFGSDVSIAWRKAICMDCGKEWQDEFTLTGVSFEVESGDRIHIPGSHTDANEVKPAKKQNRWVVNIPGEVSINWKLLKEQKKALLDLVPDNHILGGLVNMIDAIQDRLVDDHGYDEQEIFDFRKESDDEIT